MITAPQWPQSGPQGLLVRMGLPSTSWADSLRPALQLISCHYWPYTFLSSHTVCPAVPVTLELIPASGPLHWLCSLPGIGFTQVTLLLVCSLLKWLLLGESISAYKSTFVPGTLSLDTLFVSLTEPKVTLCTHPILVPVGLLTLGAAPQRQA